MSLTRRALKAMGIEEEKIEEIIAMHTETVEGLKEDIERYKEDAEAARTELDTAKSDLDTERKGDWETKYNALRTEYDDYKAGQEQKEVRKAKETAYRDLLRAAGVSEKRIGTVLKVTDLDGIELDKNGEIKKADQLTESIKTEWSDFIVSESTRGATTSNPVVTGQQGDKGKQSRAATIAAEYHKALYGTGKEAE